MPRAPSGSTTRCCRAASPCLRDDGDLCKRRWFKTMSYGEVCCYVWLLMVISGYCCLFGVICWFISGYGCLCWILDDRMWSETLANLPAKTPGSDLFPHHLGPCHPGNSNVFRIISSRFYHWCGFLYPNGHQVLFPDVHRTCWKVDISMFQPLFFDQKDSPQTSKEWSLPFATVIDWRRLVVEVSEEQLLRGLFWFDVGEPMVRCLR